MTFTSLRLGTAALLSWQEQLLGPPDPKDNGISLDGKERGHARGVQLVSAVTAKGQRWQGTERVDQKSNEIPAALPLKKTARPPRPAWPTRGPGRPPHPDPHRPSPRARTRRRLSLHPQRQSATLRQTVETLLTPQPFAPLTHGGEQRAHLGEEQEPPRNLPHPHGPGDS